MLTLPLPLTLTLPSLNSWFVLSVAKNSLHLIGLLL